MKCICVERKGNFKQNIDYVSFLLDQPFSFNSLIHTQRISVVSLVNGRPISNIIYTTAIVYKDLFLIRTIRRFSQLCTVITMFNFNILNIFIQVQL